MIHTVKGFGVVNKAEIDVFLELSCFFDDPTDVGLIYFKQILFELEIWFLKPSAVGFPGDWVVKDPPANSETCMQVRKQQLELDMEQQTGSK